MKIKTISVENFKCHVLIQNLPFYNLTTLIGENDSGKTATIDFLEIMLTNALPKHGDYHRSINHETQLEEIKEAITGEITFSLDENQKSTMAELLNQEQDLHLKRVFTKDNNHAYVFSKKYTEDRFYNFESMIAGDLKDFLEELSLAPQGNQDLRKQAIREYLQSDENQIPFIYDWKEIQYAKIKQFLPKFIRYNVDDYKNPNNLIFKVLQEVFESEIYEKKEDGTKEYKNDTLKTILDQVKSKVIEATQKFKHHIQKYNDKIVDITIEPDIDISNGISQSPIQIKDETGIFHYLESRGFGTKKRIFMAIFEWNKEVLAGIDQDYAIRCYDEPDNNLHIEAQRKLFKTIKSIIEESNGKNQVLICTHSLFMIDSAPASSINLMIRDDNGRTSVDYLRSFGDHDIQRFIEEMCREIGLSNSHIFFEKCFIVVEGQTEINFLPLAYRKYYNSSLVEDGITLINLEGNGAATNFLKLLMKNKKDLTTVFLDYDTKHVRMQKVLAAHNQLVDGMDVEEYTKFVIEFFDSKVLFVGEMEFEDSFDNLVLQAVLNGHRPKNPAPWTENDIQQIRDSVGKFSDELVKKVALDCAPNYINKPELGTLLGQEIDKVDIPEKVIELFNVARSIAGVV